MWHTDRSFACNPVQVYSIGTISTNTALGAVSQNITSFQPGNVGQSYYLRLCNLK